MASPQTGPSTGSELALSSAKGQAVPIWVADWFGRLESRPFDEMIPDPARAAVFSTDMTVGFCSKGALASARVGALAAPVTELFKLAHARGVRRFVLTQDTHDPHTPEFDVWPVHCVRGTEEAETIPELATLPFARDFVIFEKNALSPNDGTGFDAWLDANSDLTAAIVAGDCTDLCVYQLAMHLRIRANALNRAPFEVIVPANVVDTYDLSPTQVDAAGAMPHPGDFFHQVFLYHLALNGVRVVRALT
jgi:nicotinamidase-related amidase